MTYFETDEFNANQEHERNMRDDFLASQERPIAYSDAFMAESRAQIAAVKEANKPRRDAWDAWVAASVALAEAQGECSHLLGGGGWPGTHCCGKRVLRANRCEAHWGLT